MRPLWEVFVQRAVESEPDDPFVRLLRERVEAGYRIRRINLLDDQRPGPIGYLVILEYRQQLSELRVPHGQSFTRWSLERGARLDSTDEEERRFALLLVERLAPLEAEVGRDQLNACLIESLLRLAPPRTVELLGHHHAVTADVKQGSIDVEGVLTSLARALGRSLNYSPAQAAAILDGALTAVMAARFDARERELSPSAGPRSS